MARSVWLSLLRLAERKRCVAIRTYTCSHFRKQHLYIIGLIRRYVRHIDKNKIRYPPSFPTRLPALKKKKRPGGLATLPLVHK